MANLEIYYIDILLIEQIKIVNEGWNIDQANYFLYGVECIEVSFISSFYWVVSEQLDDEATIHASLLSGQRHRWLTSLLRLLFYM